MRSDFSLKTLPGTQSRITSIEQEGVPKCSSNHIAGASRGDYYCFKRTGASSIICEGIVTLLGEVRPG